MFVHAINGEYRVVATDGHRMFVNSTPIPPKADGDKLPAWLAQGVILAREGLKERLALLDKVAIGEAVELAYKIGARQVILSDLAQSCIFKLQPVDAVYSEYAKVLDGLKVFEARAAEEMASISYDSGYLKGVGDLAKLLGSKSVRVFGRTDVDEPTVVTFPECAEAILIPLRNQDKRIGFGPARALSGALAGTVAALRAHRTRWANVLEDVNAGKRSKSQAQAKVDEYDQRIAALITNAAEPALPPPPDPWEAYRDAVEAGAGHSERWERRKCPSRKQSRRSWRRNRRPTRSPRRSTRRRRSPRNQTSSPSRGAA